MIGSFRNRIVRPNHVVVVLDKSSHISYPWWVKLFSHNSQQTANWVDLSFFMFLLRRSSCLIEFLLCSKWDVFSIRATGYECGFGARLWLLFKFHTPSVENISYIEFWYLQKEIISRYIWILEPKKYSRKAPYLRLGLENCITLDTTWHPWS